MSPDTLCPSTEILHRSLDPDDPMPEPERLRVEAHVERCDRGCKQILESLLRANTLPAGMDTIRPVGAPGASPVELPAPAIPGYEILGELGRGGMGVVYKARYAGLNRLVALKMILAGVHAGAEDLARFRTEAEAVAALQHPNVVQIYEVGEQDGRPYFSLEFVDGGTLAQKLAGAPQPPGQAAELVETLARAVESAHRRGVVHRDLKPANILLTAEGLPKIADFGLAKRLEGTAGHTQTGAIVGTPSYMAPEQAGGQSKEVGPATDVYALGAILYEMLTGRPPFRAATALETLQQVLADDPAPPRQLQSKTPRDLETICLKCLEKRPARRYAAAADLADDLGRWRRGEPVRARPPSLGYVLSKQVRRHRAPLAVAAGMLLALAAVTATAFVQVLGARDEAVQKGKDLGVALNAKQAALNQTQLTLDSLKKQLSILARSYVDHSDAEYHAGNFNDGLNWMLRAYEAAPPDDPLRPTFVRLIGARARFASKLALPLGIFAGFSPDGRTVLSMDDKSARLWDAASGKELQQFRHDDGVHAASFSPDGRTVVTASSDKTARLWDAAGGKELHRLPHEEAVWAAAFSPDGRTVVTAGGYDKTACLWDAAGGKELHRLRHDAAVFAASFSPDGRTVVAVCGDKTVRLWDAADGKELYRLPHDDIVSGAAFSPDGRTVVSRDDKTVRLWDAADGKELQRFRHDYWVNTASVSPDGRTVLTATQDNTARLWNAADGKELLRLTHDAVVRTAAFSPDGRTVVTASRDKTARLWDAAGGKELQQFRHDNVVNGAAFSPDGRTIVTACLDNTVRLWDAAPGKARQQFRHDDAVNAASFSPDGRTVVTASQDKTARLWDAADGKELLRLTHDAVVRSAAFSPDGRTVVTASFDHTARLWDAADGKELHRLPHDDAVWAASFSPDGRTVLTASLDHTARLWNLADGTELHRLRHDKDVYAASFSPDGRTVVTGSHDKTARLWDVAGGKELQRLHHDFVYAASFSPDGRTVVTASSGDHSARLWDVVGGKELRRLPHVQVQTASFSPDGLTVLTAGWDKAARLWDAADGKELYQLPHDDILWSAAFSPDGATILTADDKAAHLWDAAAGKELCRLPHDATVRSAAFSRDGRSVVTAGFDHTARLWDARFLSTPDDPERLHAWVLVRTGMDITEEGAPRSISPEEWEQQRRILETPGGDWRGR